jgi:hypothetical protein
VQEAVEVAHQDRAGADGTGEAARVPHFCKCPQSAADREWSDLAKTDANDTNRTSPLRHPGHPQGLTDALASREIHRVVTWSVSAIAPDSKTRIERKASCQLVERSARRTSNLQVFDRHRQAAPPEP